jgi:hypothetical protein
MDDLENELTSEDLFKLLIGEASEKAPRGKSSKSFEEISEALELKCKDFKEHNRYSSMIAGYGADEFDEGFRAGYSAATKLLIAGLK